MSKFVPFILAALLFLLVSLVPAGVEAHHYLTEHKLSCSKDFPCPDALHGRINFWIHVFRTWGKDEAVFHDPDVPERVYSVINTGAGCGRSVSRKVKRERKRIKTALYNAAGKLESAGTLSDLDKHIINMFPSRNPKDLKAASEKIRCQSGVKESYLAGLERFHRYSYMVDTILSRHGLPSDIRYLPFVESSYNPAAYSKVGAAGMWQIMPKTARVLGLELDATIDERLDPEAATHAAARYLTDSRRSITKLARSIDPSIRDEEISPFVITSYNYGVNGMRRAIKKVAPDYLKVLQKYKSPAFQIAVKNFYSSFLAARHVAINSERYFGKVTSLQAPSFQTVVLGNATSVNRIKKVFKVSEKSLRPINLGLTRFIWNGWRLIPAGYQLKLPYRNDGYKSGIAKLKSLGPETITSGPEKYVVRRGDTACGIARALQVNCRELIAMNKLGRRALIRVGQRLVIPGRLVASQESDTQGSKTVITRETSQGEDLKYKVRRGDTACRIAKKFSVSCRELIRFNRLGRKAIIRIGQRLSIPGRIAEKQRIVRLDENNQYLVAKGDSACVIARRFGVECGQLRKLNKLNTKAIIYPGQRLKIPGYDIPSTSETAAQLAQLDNVIATTGEPGSTATDKSLNSELNNLLDTLPDLSVAVTDLNGYPVYSIRAEADETLGYYADWLGLGSTREIRNLNGLSSRENLGIRRLIKLPISSASQVSRFERRRTEYHQVLREELKEHYTLTGVSRHTIKKGETVWNLSVTVGFPVSLFYKLNPNLNTRGLVAGEQVLLPKLLKKS